MQLLILDTKLEAVAYLDTYESLIWAERYYECGDFEIYTTANKKALGMLKQDNYLWSRDSEHSMIIEEIQLKSNVEDGDELIVTGRSLESMLDRRIVWLQTILSGNFQDAIEKLLNENIISPSITERKIDNFIFERTDDPAITSLTVDAQFTGDNLYDVIHGLCKSKSVGFKITLGEDRLFRFKLYCGQDRSYDQLKNPYVVFSSKFDNIINSNYIESKKAFKTVTLVAGEGEGSDRKSVSVEIETGGGSGLNRRELFTDARDISTTVDGTTLSTAEYNAQLTQRGKEDLAQNEIIKSFEGEVETTRMFQYGVDFFKGDIVHVMDDYGNESKSRVIEVVRSEDENSIDIYPTFATVE